MDTPKLVEDLGMMFRTSKSKYKQRFGIYECKCGSLFKCGTTQIKNGSTKSCGCYRSETSISRFTTHGMRNHELYNVWINMIDRTSNKNSSAYVNYGGRGIGVCDRWFDISSFIEDMYPTYKKGLTIDRIDVNGDYNIGNCRWETRKVQSRNTRAIRSNNKSGFRGVCWNKSKLKWDAKITVDKKSIYIGRYKTAEEASEAYIKYVIDNNLEHNYG